MTIIRITQINCDFFSLFSFQKVKEDILLVAYSSVNDKVEVHPELNRSHSAIINNGHHETSRVDVL